MNTIVFLTDSWGTKYGGINSFNIDICKSLAKEINAQYQLFCFVLHGNKEDVEDARKDDINLKILQKSSTDEIEVNRSDEILSVLNDNKCVVSWWFGHDVISGAIAIELQKKSNTGKVALFHHMNYHAYSSYKQADVKEKITEQKRLLQGSDLIFAVGPKLFLSAQDKTRDTKTEVIEVVPGLHEIKGLKAPHTFSAIIFGRMEPDDDIIKQGSLAIEAFSEAKSRDGDPLGDDAVLTVLGLSNNNFKSNVEELTKYKKKSKRAFTINAYKYSENRGEIFDTLRDHSVCLMLSLHEGFGLVGWEAIAAEVPLILTKNSGLYQLIKRELGPMCSIIKIVDVSKTDRAKAINVVADTLIDLHQDTKVSKSAQKLLKLFLMKRFTWQQAAITIAKNCDISTKSNFEETVMNKWTPDLLLQSLERAENLVNQAVKRRILFGQLWDKMKYPSSIKERLILFGGIASQLCDDLAIENYKNWLVDNNKAKLYICYETGDALKVRAMNLNEEKLETDSGLPKNRLERMVEKERKASIIKEQILNRLKDEKYESVLNRVFLIPISNPLSSYSIITDNDVFFTPLLETRSTETLSFVFDQYPRQFNMDVLQYMLFNLSRKKNADSEALIKELENILKKIEIN